MNPVLIIENLTKKYGQKNVVNNISFSIRPGEIFALLGPNGAGKTTTLECIEGLRKATSGNILICGLNPVTEFKKINKLIGVQLQSSALNEIITVKEAMKFFCLYFGIKANYELLERLDLKDKFNTQFKHLSVGQQRKLTLAIALSHTPALLILDEPTAGIDVQSRIEFHKILLEEKSKGTGIMLASHDMNEVENLADKVAIMSNGKIISSGTPREIITSGDSLVKIYIKTLNNINIDINEKYAFKKEVKDDYFVFQCDNIEDVVRESLLKIKNNNDKLIDLRVERQSLEERFIDITKKGR